MRRCFVLLFPIVATAICAAMPLSVPTADAQTSTNGALDATWHSTLPVSLCTTFNGQTCTGQGWVLSNIVAQVQYHIEVLDAATGAPIPSGTNVPPGTRVLFQFTPHQYSDIYWLGTGNGWDSPYGDWIPGAAKPVAGVCFDKNYFGQVGANHDRKGYASLSIDPPQKTITGLPADCTTMSDGVSLSCDLSTPGAVNAVFNFATTYGKFWGAHGINVSNGMCVGDAQNYNLPLIEQTNSIAAHKESSSKPVTATPYLLSVPSQSIPFLLTVTGSSTTSPPTTPTLSPDASCTVGTAMNITMLSTDPDNDQIRYGIDWDADGSIDEYVPPTGYVPSGTSQTTNRIYSTEGTKTVKVMAQDSSGLTSGWASTSFTCSSPTQTPTQNTTNTGNGSSGNSGFNGNNNQNNNSNGNLSAVLRLTVPSLVARGHTVQVSWTADNVTSCLPVTGDNGDSFPQIQQSPTSFASPVGGDTSAPITTRTVYTLSCTDLNGIQRIKTATVNIQPSFKEK